MHRKKKEAGPDGALDILVLHVKNGRDIFITVMGDYRPSCFGFSVETLIRLTRPVYKLELLELMAIVSSFHITHSNQMTLINVCRKAVPTLDRLDPIQFKFPVRYIC